MHSDNFCELQMFSPDPITDQITDMSIVAFRMQTSDSLIANSDAVFN